jgi:hypothetical protein
MNTKQKENFQNPPSGLSLRLRIYLITHGIIAVFALYLAYRCNEGFPPGPIAFAILCPHLYIIYKFVSDPALCGLRA